jgi:hypothetical protein
MNVPSTDRERRRERRDQQRVRSAVLQALDRETGCPVSSVKPSHVRLYRPGGSLNENATTTAIGANR